MFLVCGEALYDVFASPADAEGSVPMHAVVGGSPLNVAIGLSRLGISAGFLAGISTDPLGQRLADHIATEGIALDFLRRKPNPTTLSLVGLREDGTPRYTFYGSNAADISLTDEDVPVLDPSVVGIHVGSYTLVCPPVADTLARLVAREGHRLVTLDPNIRPTVEPDMSIWRERIDALLPHVSVVKMSDEDAGHLFPGEAIETIARNWLAAGPALVVVTMGSAGAMAFSAGGMRRVHAPRVNVVDTVGAGDTFQAMLIAGLLQQRITNKSGVAALGPAALGDLLDRSARAAAITCQRRGADLPRAGDLA